MALTVDTNNSLQHIAYRAFIGEDAGASDGIATFAGLEVEGASLLTGAVTISGAVTQKQNVISAAATLTAAQSGSACLFSSTTGTLYTLPAPSVGLYFDFFVSVTNTSGAHKVITDAGTTLLVGQLVNVDIDTSNAVAAWNSIVATSNIAISSNGTTTGGLVGSWYRLTCISTTKWAVAGQIQGNGIVATPFATS